VGNHVERMRETTFHNWHSITDGRHDETWNDQNDDGETLPSWDSYESAL